MIKIVAVMDNRPSAQRALIQLHGLSFYVEVNGIPILFDYGSGPEFLKNAKKLGISPAHAAYTICSHSHYDHAAGYRELLDAGVSCPFITGNHFFEEKYMTHSSARYTCLGCGFSETDLSDHQISHMICGDLLEFAPGCYAVGNFPRTHSFETIPSRFVKRTASGIVPDTFEDEICLVLDHPDGLIVLLGCSHPGVLNMLSAIRKRFGRPIQAVIGGTHLMEADDERIELTLKELQSMGLKTLALNHCSGDKVREHFESNPELNGFYLGCGDCLFF